MVKIVTKTLLLFCFVFLFVSSSPIPDKYPTLNGDLSPNSISEDVAIPDEDTKSSDESFVMPESQDSYGDMGLNGEMDSEYDVQNYTYPQDNSYTGEEFNQTKNMEYMEEDDVTKDYMGQDDQSEIEDTLMMNDTITEENKNLDVNVDDDKYFDINSNYSDYSQQSPPPSDLQVNVTTSQVLPQPLYNEDENLEGDNNATTTTKEDINYDLVSEEDNDAAPEEDNDAAPEESDDAAPEEGDDAAPEEGDDAAPEEGDDAAPEEGDDAAPEEGDDAAPEEVDNAAPEEGDGGDILPTESIGFGEAVAAAEFNSTFEGEFVKEENSTETDTEVNQNIVTPVESLQVTEQLETVDAANPDEDEQADDPWDVLPATNLTELEADNSNNTMLNETSFDTDDVLDGDMNLPSENIESINGELEIPANVENSTTTSDSAAVVDITTVGEDNYDYDVTSETTHKEDYNDSRDGDSPDGDSPDGVFYNNNENDQTESMYNENFYNSKNKTPEDDGLYDGDESPAAEENSYKSDEYAAYEDGKDDPYNNEDMMGYNEKEFATTEEGKTEYEAYTDSNDQYKQADDEEEQYIENTNNYDDGDNKADDDMDDDNYLYNNNEKETEYKNQDEQYYDNDMINNGEEYNDHVTEKINTYENNYDENDDKKSQYGEFNPIQDDDTYKSNINYDDDGERDDFDEDRRDDFDEDEEQLTDFTNILFLACAAALLFLILYCGGWVLCTRSVMKTLEKTQRLVTGRSKFGDGYTLLPNANAKRA